QQVMASIAPQRDAVPVPALLSEEAHQQLFAFDQHNVGKKQHLAKLLNWALHDVLAQYENSVVFGEDVGKKGGVYGVTQHLVHAFG
ncbi:MFS transporter, partial [Halomonas sp. SIMBA_159]